MPAFPAGPRGGSPAREANRLPAPAGRRPAHPAAGGQTQSLAHEVLTLGAGGPDAGDDDLLAAAEALVAIARRLAPAVSYAQIVFEPGSSQIAAAPRTDRLPPPRERERPAGVEEISRFSGELVQYGFGYQILGPGHLAGS